MRQSITQTFVEYDGFDTSIEPVSSRCRHEALDYAPESAWRFRFFDRRWERAAHASGWSDPSNVGPWVYFGVEIVDESEMKDSELSALKDRRDNSAQTLAVRLPNGSLEFLSDGSVLINLDNP